MGMSYQLELPCFSDHDGMLSTFEEGMIPDFQPKRIFYIYDVPEDAERANHACMNSNIVFIAVSGSLALLVETNNVMKGYVLDKKTSAIYVPACSWIVARNFSRGAVLMGISDKVYQDCIYLDDYKIYKQGEKKK